MRGTATASVLLLSLLAACAAPDGPGASTSTTEPPPPPHVRFVALGDQGTGGPDQVKVARAMGTVCALRGCDFALALGDNIYDAGANSPRDPQFDSKFEVPYANLTFPFYLVLGNHDNGDPGHSPAAGLGPWHETGNNQVRYSQRTDRASDKWHMPARYYNATFGDPNGTDGLVLDLFALDTNTLVYYDLPVPPDLEAKVQAQSDWIDGALAASDAPWRIAIGHHPYISNGRHGDAGSYDGNPLPGLSGGYLKEFFEAHLCGEVDVYLAGHDHNLQWLDAVPSCGRTMFVVSGGGGAGTYGLGGSHAAQFQRETLGFWWFDLTPDGLHAIAYDGQRLQLFEGTLTRQ